MMPSEDSLLIYIFFFYFSTYLVRIPDTARSRIWYFPILTLSLVYWSLSLSQFLAAGRMTMPTLNLTLLVWSRSFKSISQSVSSFDLKQAWNTFSLKSVRQVFQYTSFPIIRVHKLSKVQVTKVVQSPSCPNCQSSSHPRCPKPKSPKLSNDQVPQIVKAQVTQSSSHPKLKLPKV